MNSDREDRLLRTFAAQPSQSGSSSTSVLGRWSTVSTTATQKLPFAATSLLLYKPSDGLEPSTPSLPWRFPGVTRVHTRSSAARFFLQMESCARRAMRHETSRVSFLMCPFCVRALMSIEATQPSLHLLLGTLDETLSEFAARMRAKSRTKSAMAMPLARGAAATAAIDAPVDSGRLLEQATDDHDVRGHYTNGADLIDAYTDKRRQPRRRAPSSARTCPTLRGARTLPPAPPAGAPTLDERPSTLSLATVASATVALIVRRGSYSQWWSHHFSKATLPQCNGRPGRLSLSRGSGSA
jgi:hypothetical protein